VLYYSVATQKFHFLSRH